MARERVQAQEAEKLSLKSLPRIWWSRIQTQVSLSSQSLSETCSFGTSLGLSRKSGDMPNRTELPPGRDCSFVHLRVRMPAHSFWTESSEGSQRPLEGGRGPRTSSNNGFWDARTPGTWEMSEVNQERGSQWGNCQEHALPPTPACAPGGGSRCVSPAGGGWSPQGQVHPPLQGLEAGSRGLMRAAQAHPGPARPQPWRFQWVLHLCANNY